MIRTSLTAAAAAMAMTGTAAACPPSSSEEHRDAAPAAEVVTIVLAAHDEDTGGCASVCGGEECPLVMFGRGLVLAADFVARSLSNPGLAFGGMVREAVIQLATSGHANDGRVEARVVPASFEPQETKASGCRKPCTKTTEETTLSRGE